MAGLTLENISELNRHYYVVVFHVWDGRGVLRLPGETGDGLAGQERNKVVVGEGGGEERRAGKSAAASLEKPAVNHQAEWADLNCKGIIVAELSALIPGLRLGMWHGKVGLCGKLK